MRSDWKIADSTTAPAPIRGAHVDRLHRRLAAEMEATGRRVTHVSIRERPERAEVAVYGGAHG